jgi:hypothetical protein
LLHTLFQNDPATESLTVPKRRTDMTFLRRLLAESCSHRFTWPRLPDDDQHYQICLICGTAYEYDWKRMHRTDRLLVMNGQHALDTTGVDYRERSTD